MKKETYSGAVENEIITSMITDNQALGLIASRWEGDMFSVNWMNMIASWCVKHFQEHSEAPCRAVETYFSQWAEKSSDESLVENIHRYLSIISDKSVYNKDKHEPINPQRIADMAGKCFRKNKLAKLADSLQQALRVGDVEGCETLVTKHSRVELGQESGLHLLNDDYAFRSTFYEENTQQLLTFPGDLGEFYANEMEQTGFLVFAGAQKSGKSICLVDMAYRAIAQRRKVAFFSVGDMSERQMKERITCRIACHPTRSGRGKWPLTIKIPIRIEPPGHWRDPAEVSFREVTFNEPLTEEAAVEARDRLINNKIKSWDSYFCLSCHPSRGISIAGIKGVLERWEIQQGFVPQVVIIDYMDNLLHEDKTEKRNDQVNTTWKLTKAMTEERHCLIMSATQINADGFKKRLLDRSNFSEDNRKLSEVTGLVGINTSSPEKERGVTRYNWIVKRYGEFSHRWVIHCAGHLGLCNPAMISTFPLPNVTAHDDDD